MKGQNTVFIGGPVRRSEAKTEALIVCLQRKFQSK
jgi:hypothetical protein